MADEREGFNLLVANGITDGSIVAADGPPITEVPLHLMTSKKVAASQQVVDRFNAGLDAIRKNGMYDRILKRYAPVSKGN